MEASDPGVRRLHAEGHRCPWVSLRFEGRKSEGLEKRSPAGNWAWPLCIWLSVLNVFWGLPVTGMWRPKAEVGCGQGRALSQRRGLDPSGLVRLLCRQEVGGHVHRWEEIYHKEPADVVVEAAKSQECRGAGDRRSGKNQRVTLNSKAGQRASKQEEFSLTQRRVGLWVSSGLQPMRRDPPS